MYEAKSELNHLRKGERCTFEIQMFWILFTVLTRTPVWLRDQFHQKCTQRERERESKVNNNTQVSRKQSRKSCIFTPLRINIHSTSDHWWGDPGVNRRPARQRSQVNLRRDPRGRDGQFSWRPRKARGRQLEPKTDVRESIKCCNKEMVLKMKGSVDASQVTHRSIPWEE